MPVDNFTPYELWDLQKPAIPQRSRLYNLEPIGVGTPYVESLTGYVARLAEAHALPPGILILTEIAPLVKEGYVFSDSNKHKALERVYGSGNERRILNGMDLTATALVQALETLTQRENLHFLTLVTWGDVLSSKGLLRESRAWCPICYDCWDVTGQTVYEPLIWALDVVTVCPLHRCPLETQCPSCDKKNWLLEWRSRPGYCTKCGKWLGAFFNAGLKDVDEWHLWAAYQVGNLIATAPYLPSRPFRESLKGSISKLVELVSGGNRAAFAALLGKHTKTVSEWCLGTSIPNVRNLLQICDYFGLSLVNLLLNKDITIDSSRLNTLLQEQKPYQPRHPKRDKHFPPNMVRSILNEALNESPPPTMTEVVGRFYGLSFRYLYKHFPEEWRTISSRHKKYKKDEYLFGMYCALEEVLKSNEYPPPSLRKVGEKLGYCRQALRKHFQNECDTISERYAEYKNVCAVQRKEQLRQQIQQAAFELHAQGIYVNSDTVGKLLKKPGILRSEEARVALREVQYELYQEQKIDNFHEPNS
jgi:transcriptional regulator with XRE-family HTH domain